MVSKVLLYFHNERENGFSFNRTKEHDMAIYTEQELNTLTSDQIRTLVKHGYKIDGDNSISNNWRLFKAVLRTEFPVNISVTFRELMTLDRRVMRVDINSNELPELNHHKIYTYHKVKDNLYTDRL